MGTDDAIQGVNPSEMTLPRFPLCRLGWKLDINALSCMKKEFTHLNVCHGNGNLRIRVQF
jgi:hypothetical protein